jgi:hypothetical protein
MPFPALESCSLCLVCAAFDPKVSVNESDPRGGLWTEEGFYPLCDACQPRDWPEALAIGARLIISEAPVYVRGSRFAPDVLEALPTWGDWASGAAT